MPRILLDSMSESISKKSFWVDITRRKDCVFAQLALHVHWFQSKTVDRIYPDSLAGNELDATVRYVLVRIGHVETNHWGMYLYITNPMYIYIYICIYIYIWVLLGNLAYNRETSVGFKHGMIPESQSEEVVVIVLLMQNAIWNLPANLESFRI